MITSTPAPVGSPEYNAKFARFCQLYGPENVVSVSEALSQERWTVKETTTKLLRSIRSEETYSDRLQAGKGGAK